MKCNDVLLALEDLCPMAYKEAWDNVGLLVGDKNRNVETVYIALDPSSRVIDHAISSGADLLLTHHPLIFKPMKSVVADDIIGGRVMKLIQNDISYIAMHTNFDVMGMADAAADRLGLKTRAVLEITYEDDISGEGIGRVGVMEQSMMLSDYARFVAQKFSLDSVRVYGDLDKQIKVVACVPGSGSEYFMKAKEAGADVLVTGDVTHHKALDAVEAGIAVIDASHYGTEKIFRDYMLEFFKRQFPELQVVCDRDVAMFTDIEG